MFADDDRPVKKPVHTVGEDLSLLSEHELEERIALCEAEIARIQQELTRKKGGRAAADAVFKR
ncbi:MULTISPECIES: DUF1192 domain-containing protein [Hyphomicrobiales]|uniref:Uncharacterized small protein (DUF1192 family) n=1 Tax=Rhodopseudomonas julia TaxID=200617 RepID=A0ABU0C682_9BRAD|nr:MULTISPECIES: DUF1192 domain-containing protein [Hyphomicrobiales]MDQ0326023.1 uncharacterized small protein (DUF1192 family) [Rhodopseudomonas julia]